MKALLDFLSVGHVTIDELDSERRLGGAAAYAAVTAKRLGMRTGLVTAAGSDFPFWRELEADGIEVLSTASARSTTFENRYRDAGREQRVVALAEPIDPRALFEARARLRRGAVLFYGPVVHELSAPLEPFRTGLTVVAPQGFFREWREGGVVAERVWPEAEEALAAADIVCMSENDSAAPEALAESFPGRAFAVTRGARGCRIYARGNVHDFGALPAAEVDPTGAGDVFAAAFAIATWEGRSLPEAARFAAAAAAIAVESEGLAGIPTREGVEARLAA